MQRGISCSIAHIDFGSTLQEQFHNTCMLVKCSYVQWRITLAITYIDPVVVMIHQQSTAVDVPLRGCIKQSSPPDTVTYFVIALRVQKGFERPDVPIETRPVHGRCTIMRYVFLRWRICCCL